MLQILKKDNTLEDWNEQKIVYAVNKSASRVMINLTDENYEFICEQVEQVCAVFAPPFQKYHKTNDLQNKLLCNKSLPVPLGTKKGG